MLFILTVVKSSTKIMYWPIKTSYFTFSKLNYSMSFEANNVNREINLKDTTAKIPSDFFAVDSSLNSNIQLSKMKFAHLEFWFRQIIEFS